MTLQNKAYDAGIVAYTISANAGVDQLTYNEIYLDP